MWSYTYFFIYRLYSWETIYWVLTNYWPFLEWTTLTNVKNLKLQSPSHGSKKLKFSEFGMHIFYYDLLYSKAILALILIFHVVWNVELSKTNQRTSTNPFGEVSTWWERELQVPRSWSFILFCDGMTIALFLFFSVILTFELIK